MGLRALLGGCVAILVSTAACAEVAGVDFGGATLRNDSDAQSASVSCDQSCQALGFECGAQFDSCGKPKDCGTCSDGRACENGKCACSKKSCVELGKQCGTHSDGCGGVVECGACANPSEVCGDGLCRCQPKSCKDQGAQCGNVPDGCGGQYTCGDCSADPANPYCGGGGANKCGGSPCVPKTCLELGKNCGSVSDGCGAVLPCGECTAPATCGGNGVANVCGCKPTTCAIQGKNCGTIPDGCGGTLNCGGCTAPETCQGAGVPNLCGCTSNGSCSETCGTGVDNCNRPCTRTIGCGGGGGGCFARGTLVRMADGTSKPIETVKVGELVTSYDLATKTMVTARVLATPVHGPESSAHGFVVVHGSGGTLRVTPNHPLIVDGVEMRAESLRAGSRIVTPGVLRNTPASLREYVLDLSARTESVDLVEVESGNGESTYDLKVDGPGGFFANSVLVQQKRNP